MEIARSDHTSKLGSRSLNELLGNGVDFLFHLLAFHSPKVAPESIAASIGVIGAWILLSEASGVVLFHFLALHSPEVAPESIAASIGVIGAWGLFSEASFVVLFHLLAFHSPKIAPESVAASIGVIGAWILLSEASGVVLRWCGFAHFSFLVAHTSLTALTIQAVAINSHAIFLLNA